MKENNENLNNILVEIGSTQEKMKLSAENLVEVSEKAKESIPSIDNYFKNTNIYIKNTVDNLQDTLDKNIELVEDHIEKLTVDVSQNCAISTEHITELFKQYNLIFKKEVEDYMSNFEIIINQLRVCIPEINDHLEQTKERFNNTLSAFTSEVQNSLQLNMEYMNSQAELLKKTTNNINNNLDSVINDSTKRLEDITINTSSQIKNIVEEMENVFEKKVEQLDDLLQEELTKSLTSFGSQLVTISERFSKDYTPLANKLREVVNIAQGVV
ncbi:hypothetical protein [Romboutsia sp.]|uniref:hypothetical protein n=1 Tax=Romboutsia sp. TaxID=1965302 RepID=UPI003F3F4417